MWDVHSAVCRRAPVATAARLPELVPQLIAVASKDDDECRENALQALERALLRCPREVTPFINTIIETASLLIKYDPVSLLPQLVQAGSALTLIFQFAELWRRR